MLLAAERLWKVLLVGVSTHLTAYDQYLERLQKTLPGVILMAHSQGCTFALNAARKYPDFVKALVLVECAFTGYMAAQCIRTKK